MHVKLKPIFLKRTNQYPFTKNKKQKMCCLSKENKNSPIRVTVQMDGDILCLRMTTLRWTGHYLRSQ